MHLSSPKLSSFEERLVRFARETVRYRVETMHDHCKKFFSDLSRPQVVEIIGFCSLVNALGRMTFMMEQ